MLRDPDPDMDGYYQLFGMGKGERISFDPGLCRENKVIPPDCAGLTWQNVTYGFTNTLEKLKLSPLGLL